MATLFLLSRPLYRESKILTPGNWGVTNWKGLYMVVDDGFKVAYKPQSPNGKTELRSGTQPT